MCQTLRCQWSINPRLVPFFFFFYLHVFSITITVFGKKKMCLKNKKCSENIYIIWWTRKHQKFIVTLDTWGVSRQNNDNAASSQSRMTTMRSAVKADGDDAAGKARQMATMRQARQGTSVVEDHRSVNCKHKK